MGLVLFFDGDCGFCSKSVRAVHRLDKRGHIEFSPLQGKLAGELGLEKYAEKAGGSMVIIREPDGMRFFKGDAWIVLGKELGGIWAVLSACFSILPKAARNLIYDLVARNRYLLPGKGDSCEMPEESLRRRMRE